MKIEAGKYYRTRDGYKVGPMFFAGPVGSWYPWQCKETSVYGEYSWSSGGLCVRSINSKLDLIAEWTDEPKQGPVRTVTRKEIVPGVYGRVTVERLNNGDWCFEVRSMRTASELTQAIQTLTEIRDAIKPS